MQLQIEINHEKLYARLNGEFDMLVADKIRAELDKHLSTKQIRLLIFDLTHATFIDSSGVGVILGRYKILAETGGRVKIMGSSPPVTKILSLSGLNRIIEIEELNDCQIGTGS